MCSSGAVLKRDIENLHAQYTQNIKVITGKSCLLKKLKNKAVFIQYMEKARDLKYINGQRLKQFEDDRVKRYQTIKGTLST